MGPRRKRIGSHSQISDLAQLDVMAVVSPTCGYCKKFLKMLEDAGETKSVNIIDMSNGGLNDNDHSALQKMGFTGGVPFITSRTTNKNHPGCPKSLEQLVQALSGTQSSNPTPSNGPLVNQAKDLGIVFYGRQGCPHCVKMKEMLEADGLMSAIDFVDTGTPQGQRKMPKNVKGVPHLTLKNRTEPYWSC